MPSNMPSNDVKSGPPRVRVAVGSSLSCALVVGNAPPHSLFRSRWRERQATSVRVGPRPSSSSSTSTAGITSTMCEGVVVPKAAPHGRQNQLVTTSSSATMTAAGASTAETTDIRNDDDLKKPQRSSMQPTEADAPCFPSCLEMDTDLVNQVRVVVDTPSESPSDTIATTGRRSRRNSRRQSSSGDNLRDTSATPSLDLEDVAFGVPSPIDTASIVVDYDEGMPERSRTDLLLRPDVPPSDCAPDACNPLDTFPALEDLTISDSSRITSRPRVNSASHPTPTSSRRGKSVVLASVAIEPEVERPLAALKAPEVTAEEDEDSVARCSTLHKLCLCEVRLHATRESCWLVASGSVYDVTGLVDVHPGGARSILRKAGGADCTKDMKFHSKAARKMLEKCFIGKLVPCGDDPQGTNEPAACTIM